MMSAEQQNVPTLRFPEFSGSWETDKLGNYILRVGEPITVEPNKLYREIGIRSHGKGLFHKPPVTGASLGNKRVFNVHIPALTVNIVFAWEHAIATTTKNERGFIASHRFPMYVPINQKSTILFVRYFFLRKYGKHLLELASPGGAGRNKTLGQKDFLKLKVTFPQALEQQKIASFLSVVDTKIEQLGKKKALLEQYKKGMMQKLFPSASSGRAPELRFKDEQGNDFPDWEEKRLRIICEVNPKLSCLPPEFVYIDLESVVKGLLIKENKIQKSGAPSRAQRRLKVGDVLFQMVRPYQKNNYYFDKEGDYVASTGYAQLRAQGSAKFLYQLLHTHSFVNMVLARCTGTSYPAINSNDLGKINISIPLVPEQQKIANFLSTIDEKIDLINTELEKAQTFKKGLLQQMFV